MEVIPCGFCFLPLDDVLIFVWAKMMEEYMFIKEITVKNFRIFGENGVSFQFRKGINAVIGENNVGKSALIDAIRIAFSCGLYKKDIYFNKTDFHISASGKRAQYAQIDVYLEDVPRSLIEIWDPEDSNCGEFHVSFSLENTPSGHERVKYRAWGGKCEGNPLSVDTLEAINLAYLGALRDAENEMKPARNSKLAVLLETLASDSNERDEFVKELRKANQAILQTETMKQAKSTINKNLFDLEQPLLHQQIELGLVEPKFESIMSSLCSWIMPRWYFMNNSCPYYREIVNLFNTDKLRSFIQIQENGALVDVDSFLAQQEDIKPEYKEILLSLKNYSFELRQNGLGYNNLLFISAVLGDMSLQKNGIYSNIFLVEEPEAHLHPQLQELVLNFFRKKVNQHNNIQVIMTSHSPTLVSKIGIDHINLLYEYKHSVLGYSFAQSSLLPKEKDYLEKYLDVTKSQLFFAKGIIFVEGISEAILLPEFAKLLDRPLDTYAVELVNINGVGFEPFAKMIKIPNQSYGFAKASIITDDDRCSDKGSKATYISKDLDFDDDLCDELEKIEKGDSSDRYKKISELCSDQIVACFGAKKTFEFELALNPNNVPYMIKAIMEIHPIAGQKLKEKVDAEQDANAKALMIWLFIRSRDSAKAQVAQALSRILKKPFEQIKKETDIDQPFIVPHYIQEAIYNVTRSEDAQKE